LPNLGEHMFALFVLVIISLLIAIGFLISFIWAVKTNQFEDDYTPSVRILFDDETVNTDNSNQN
jgi:cbb3-type cytochrome oxidase maturation protein